MIERLATDELGVCDLIYLDPPFDSNRKNKINMTLHITRLSKSFVLQVSDRLVSGSQADPLANKNVIYFARDAVVAIGYTGLAYGISACNRNTPTDEWIAEVLWGREIPRGLDGLKPVTFASSKITNWLDIGQSVELLRASLQESIEALHPSHKKYPFEMVIAGWQEAKRGIIVPILVQISKPAGSSLVSVERQLERNWHLDKRIMANATPSGYLSDAECSVFQEKFPTANADESEGLMVDAIRSVSTRHTKTVGPHCMSILLQPPDVIRARFIPSVEHIAAFMNKAGITVHEFPIAYSPWIVGPSGFCAPSGIVAQWEFDVGGPVKVVMEGPPNGGRGYIGSHARPAPYPDLGSRIK